MGRQEASPHVFASRIGREASAASGFVLRHTALAARQAPWETVFLVYTGVNALTVGFIGVARRDPALTKTLVLGALLWGFLAVLFSEVAEAVALERWEGTLEYTFMAPIRRLTHLGGICLYAGLYGALRMIAVAAVVALAFDLGLDGANLGAAFLVLAVSSLSFVGLGIVGAAFPVLSPEKGAQATYILQALLLLVSGVYYEVSALPPWIQALARLSPATYTLRAMRATLLGGASLRDVTPDLAALAVAGVILIPAGLRIFAAAEAYAKRSGLLKRTG